MIPLLCLFCFLDVFHIVLAQIIDISESIILVWYLLFKVLFYFSSGLALESYLQL
jgi:hypothetical protein